VTDPGARIVSAVGLIAMIAIGWLFSADRRRFPWRTVAWGTGLQLALAVVLLRTAVGEAFFLAMNRAVATFISYVDAGVEFVFGALAQTGFSIVVNVLPIIVFMGSIFSILYHLRILQRVVDATARLLSRTMATSGAESLAAVANVFLGMVEAALVVRPYLDRMTRSELFALMTTGMASVAGSVLVAYVGMLGAEYAGHLATASLLSAPAGLLLAKVIVPETGAPETATTQHAPVEVSSVNVIDAAAQGAIAGLRLAAYVGALLVAFVALVAMLNHALGAVGAVVGLPDLSMQRVLGFALAPLAWLMGVPWHDAAQVGALLGVKTVLNEFIAYQELGALIHQNALAERSAVIASYALCGFANFGSLAILLGGIGGLAPQRRAEVARLGMLSILSGSLASFMTACVAGIFL
jgi:CNT family concentrative nucleoside transporter